MPDQSRILPEFEVCSWDGNKIGRVSNIAPNYFEVSTGFLGLGHPLFIPYDAVSGVDDANHRVNMCVASDAIPAERWKNRPAAAAQAAGAGTLSGTVPAASATSTKGWIQPQDLIGKTLYSWDNQKIGDVSSVEPTFADVQTGFLGLGETLHVPYSAINYCDQQGCHVNMSLDQIKTMNWNAPAVSPPARTRQAGQAPQTIPIASTPTPSVSTPQGVQPVRIPLYEEDLEVRKHRERVGEVVVRRNVVTEKRTIEVPIEREEVTIERRFVDRPVPPGAQPFAEGEKELTFPVYEEQVDVQKVPRQREELIIQPEATTREQEVSGTVRRETANVETEGKAAPFVSRQGSAAPAQPGGFRPWNEVMPTFQQRFRQQSGGMTWQQAEPAYRFGYTNFYSPNFQNMTWQQAEPGLRQEWQSQNPNLPWDQVKNLIQGEWNRLSSGS